MIPRPALLCDDERCLCRGAGVFDLDQLQADGAQESPPRLALPSDDDELARRAKWGDR